MNALVKTYRLRFYGDDHDGPMQYVAEATSASSAKEIVRRIFPGVRIVRCEDLPDQPTTTMKGGRS